MGHPECFEPRFDLCSIRFSSGGARGCKPIGIKRRKDEAKKTAL
jgi:hypothetical protein